MSTRAVGDLSAKVDDQTHDRKLQDARVAAQLKQQQRLSYWLQMGGDYEFTKVPTYTLSRVGGATPSTTNESTNPDGVLAHAEAPMAGMGLFMGGITADRELKLHKVGEFSAQLTKAVTPLMTMLAEAPPDGIEAAGPFQLATALKQQQINVPGGASKRMGDGGVNFPLGTSTFKKVGEFSAVFSKSEQHQVLNAMQRVYDRQLQALSNPAVDTADAAQASMHLEAAFDHVMKHLGPDFKKMAVDSGYTLPNKNKTLELPNKNKLITMPPKKGDTTGATPPPSGGESGDTSTKVGGVDGVEALMKRIDQALAGVDPDGAAALANMDIDSLIQMVLMEVATDQEKELRVLADKMQHSNQMKAKQRELQSIYRHAQATLADDMRKEFEQLKAKGMIGEGVSFDDYKGWRQICVGEPARDPLTGDLLLGPDGKIQMSEPALAQPSPPIDLPAFLSEDQNTEAGDTSGAGGPSDGLHTSGPGGEYGITSDQYDMLKEYFMNYAGPTAWDNYGHTADGFKDWLTSEVGLSAISGADDIAANNQAIDDFLATVGDIDQGLSGISDLNAAELDTLITDCQALTEQWCLTADPAILALVTQKLRQIETFVKTKYLDHDDMSAAMERIRNEIKVGENGSLGFIGDNLPDSDFFDKLFNEMASGALTNTPHDNDGNDILPLTDEVLAGWKQTQADAEEQLDDVAVYTYGLNEEQIEVLQKLAAMDGSLYNGDMKAWLEQMGLKSPNDADYSAEANAEAIRSFMQQLAGTATNDSGPTIQKLGQLHVTQASPFPQMNQGNNGPIDGAALSDLLERFDFATDGGIDVEGYGLPSEMGPGFEDLWLRLPASQRAQYGNDFEQFIASLQLSSGDGPGNIAKLRAFLDGLEGVNTNQFEGMLDVAEKPIANDKFPFSESVQDGLEYLWSVLNEEQRANFGNDINRWMQESLGFDPNPASIAQNLEKLKQHYADGPYGPVVVDMIFAGKFDLEKRWTLPSPTDAEKNEFLEDLIAQGIIERPGDAPDFTSQANNNNDPATGDNLVTGAKAQSAPDGHDGRLMSLNELAAYEQDAKDTLDGISEMSELDMLELQLKNDRRQRALEALSAVMKKVANSADGIIANFK